MRWREGDRKEKERMSSAVNRLDKQKYKIDSEAQQNSENKDK